MSKFWSNLSDRERLLALIVVLLIGGGVAYSVTVRALGRLHSLDVQIENMEQQLANLTGQATWGPQVNVAFAEIAAEHSSAWTKEEIHDRLRHEIYRLALKTPPPPGAREIGPSQGEALVTIPTLLKGTSRRSIISSFEVATIA